MSAEQAGFFGGLSFWRCIAHFPTYLRFLYECQQGERRWSSAPPYELRKGGWLTEDEKEAEVGAISEEDWAG